MAEVIQFTDILNTVLLDLNDANGITIIYRSGSPTRAADPEAPVIDTYQCKITATSDDDLAAQLIALNRILEQATRYDKDSTEENEIWLEHQLDGETNARRTLVLGGSWQYNINPAEVPTSDQHVASITLAIKHMPGYESKAVTAITGTALTVFGGAVDLSSQGVGDMPGRATLTITGNTGTIETLWFGMRSELKHAGVAHFVPIWEAEKGTMGTNTATSSTYDASSTGSTPKAVLVSFANANWDERVRITAAQVAADYEYAQAGRFLVMGRMRLDTGTDTVQVRLRSGWYNAAVTPQYRTLDPVTISGTSFQYYELGTVKFPPIFGSALGSPSAFGYAGMTMAALSLLAARTSGTTSKLVIDHFALIPIDEGFSKISGLALSGTDFAYISSTPKNTPMTAAFSGTGFTSSPAISQNNFYIPVGTCSLYVFGQRSGVSTIGDTIDYQSISRTRYFSLRGAV